MSEACAVAVQIPKFVQIIHDLETLILRLEDTTKISVRISDALIDPHALSPLLEDTEKPIRTPDCFASTCFDLLSDFQQEVEKLESVNDRLLRQVQEVD